MVRTNNFKLSRQDICLIIETCAKNGVTILKFGDLDLNFGKPAEPVQIASTPDKAISDANHELNTKNAIEKDEIDLREDAIAHMIVENPVMAEQMLLDEELEDADDEQSEFDESDDLGAG